jgi:hypothetical protein
VCRFVKALRVIAMAQQGDADAILDANAGVSVDALDAAIAAGTLGVAKLQGLCGDDNEGGDGGGGGGAEKNPFDLHGVAGGLPSSSGPTAYSSTFQVLNRRHEPYTLNSISYTLNSRPYTLDPKF